MKKKDTFISGNVYVLADNIDTDLIIPARYLTLVPTIPDEYRQLGSYALAGLPDGFPPFVADGRFESEYPIIVAGRNFGCGSSREHAPIALAAAGVKAVIAQSYARIFFRNVLATGELFPLETDERICEIFKTGDEAELDVSTGRLVLRRTGIVYPLKSLGAATDVIEAGGIFGYARATGMIK
jgi:3-isopropylmalate/(R)-2-methylmalate dehydratase small subunit